MTTVIKLGGVNGSGKTTIAREVIKLANATPTRRALASGKPTTVYIGEYSGLRVCVLGSYENACGGMDTISNKDDRFDLVKAVAQSKGCDIVFFEGLITGKTYGALGELSEQHVNKGKAVWLYAFMDTAFDECVARVLKRRLEAGNTAPFDPQRTMRSTYRSCVSLLNKLTGGYVQRGAPPMQHPTHVIKSTRKPATEARKLLDRAVEMYHAR